MKHSTAQKLWHRTTGMLVPVWLLLGLVAAALAQAAAFGPWLMVHLLLLGGVSTAILVWSQYFADSLLKNTAPGGRASLGVRLAVHTVGAATVMTGIVYGWWIVTLIGGILVGGTALLHAALLIGQLRGALPARFSRLVRYYVASASALIVGVTLGVMMAHPESSIINTAGEYYERLYIGHLALNLLGWIGLTVIGTVALLWPTVLRSPVVQTTAAAARSTLPILVGGLTVITVGSLLDSRYLAAAGVLIYLVGLVRVLTELVGHARRLPVISYSGWSLGAAVVWFALCTAAFGMAVAVADSWADAAASVEALVPYFAVGFAGQIVIGALSYLIGAVLPGGPLAKAGIFAELDRAGLFRVAVVNGGLLLTLLPLPVTAVTLLMALVLLTLASFLVFMVRALRESRRLIAALVAARPPAGRRPGLLPAGLPVTGNPAPVAGTPALGLSSAPSTIPTRPAGRVAAARVTASAAAPSAGATPPAAP
ncbi:copper oxidase, partial [Cryobacterium melibiosiphilum]